MASYCVHPEPQLVVIRPTGRFTETEFIELLEAVYDDPARQPHFSALWETRAIDELAMGADVIPMYQQFLRENEARITEGKIAIVTDGGTDEAFATMLTKVATTATPTYQLFHSVDAAVEWLGLSSDVLVDLPRLQE